MKRKLSTQNRRFLSGKRIKVKSRVYNDGFSFPSTNCERRERKAKVDRGGGTKERREWTKEP